LIGHGAAIGFAFGVQVVGDDVSAEWHQFLVSPMRRALGGVTFEQSASLDVLERLASIMEAHRGRSELQVRACYLSSATRLGYAATLRREVPTSNVQLTGYTDFYALVVRDNGTFRSEIQRESHLRRDEYDTVSRASGLAAPTPQITDCVRGGDVLDGLCP
jgi:hypothetical protein